MIVVKGSDCFSSTVGFALLNTHLNNELSESANSSVTGGTLSALVNSDVKNAVN